MPSFPTHALVGLGLADLLDSATGSRSPHAWWLSAVLAVLPDLDVLAFPLGIPYGHRFGHRGFFHSLACAVLVTLPLALGTAAEFPGAWWHRWGYLFLVMASHGLLDGFTNGGLGIALLAPFDDTRYFFPWQPIQVAPLGRAFFGPWGLRVLVSEAIWIWTPLGALIGMLGLFQGR